MTHKDKKGTMHDKQLPKHRTLMPIIRDLVMAVTERGHNPQEFCQRIGLSLTDLQQDNVWVDLKTGHRVWQEALAVTQDVYLGLHIGQKSNVSVAGVVAYLIQSCPDLLTAFSKMCEYNATYTTVFNYAIEEKPPHEVWISYDPVSEWVNKYPATAQQAIETSMTRTCSILRLLSGKALKPLRACFGYSLNKDLHVYQKLLCEQVQFGCSQNQLVFALADLQNPVLTANKTLQIHFEQLVQAQLPTAPANVWANKVRQTIVNQPLNLPPILQDIAERLQLSPRSLQRKLKDEGYTFLAIANDIQQQRAIHLLRQTQLNVSEVAYMMGYAEPSVFRRAFKRWTGKTPKEYLKN